MNRPLWVWVVFLMSMVFTVTGLIGSGTGILFTFSGYQITQMEKMRSEFSSLPNSQEVNSQFDRMLEEQKKIASDPLRMSIAVVNCVLKFIISLALLVGGIRLFKMNSRGIGLLVSAYFADILLVLFGMTTSYILNKEYFQTLGTFSSAGLIAMVMTIIFSLILNGIPILCLLFGSKDNFFDEERDSAPRFGAGLAR